MNDSNQDWKLRVPGLSSDLSEKKASWKRRGHCYNYSHKTTTKLSQTMVYNNKIQLNRDDHDWMNGTKLKSNQEIFTEYVSRQNVYRASLFKS